MNKLVVRILTSLVLSSIIYTGLLYPFTHLLSFFYLTVILFMFYEWILLTRNQVWLFLPGLIPIYLTMTTVLTFRTPEYRYLMTLFFSNIAYTDIAAYFFGKSLGGRKLIPSVSPNKTVAGSIAGLTISLLVVYITKSILGEQNYYFYNEHFVLKTLFISALSQVSDLYISVFKRISGVKDTSNFLPGHGGFLDRFDSYILTSCYLLFYMKFNQFM